MVRTMQGTTLFYILRFDTMNLALIEGFGGKRALGFLLKSELCQKRSKFRMQLCLGVFSNVLHVFCLKFASFLRYYVCKKHIFFQGHPLGTFY